MLNESVENGAEPELEYQGRKASRAKSEHRRRLILEAALRIVIQEGVRGIRHRAVAKEAGVPLAATTYYFKDIDELITDAFTLYTEKALAVIDNFTQQFYQPFLQGMSSIDLSNTENHHVMVELLVEQLAEYVRVQSMVERNMLIIEQAFRYEAIVNDRIRDLAYLHRETLFAKVVEFLTVVKSPAPEQDAHLLLALFHSLEYNALLQPHDQVDMVSVANILRRFLTMLVANIIASQRA